MASALEGASGSALQGVSQQVPSERLPGQCSEQLNMLSDPVTGVRRRPGAKYIAELSALGAGQQLFTANFATGGAAAILCVNTETGAWCVVDAEGQPGASGTDPYLVAENASSIQAVSLGGVMYLVNTGVAPVSAVDNTGKLDPNTTGFFFIRSGAFSKTYSVVLKVGATTYTGTYTTPDGTTAGDADKSVPEYIATKLRESLVTAGASTTWLSQVGANVAVQQVPAGPVSVVSDSGTQYVGVSTVSNVPLESDLAPYLPDGAAGLMCSVGIGPTSTVWYIYQASTRTWLEVGAYNSPGETTPATSPRKFDGSAMASFPLEGRLAGDDETNESPAFIREGMITGIGAYQGRLVLLAGAHFCASASGKPARFYRSTVTTLLPGDRIDIASGSAQSAVFRQAAQFNRDLVLLGDTAQAVVPAGQTLLAPDTASIVLTSDLLCDSRIRPAGTTQTLLYPSNRGREHAAVLELVPSQYTSSQYVTQDITTHLPKYLPGAVRLAAGGTNANMAVFGITDESVLVVHQYMFTSEGKVQQAWHRWEFPTPVLSAEFTRDGLFLFLGIGGTVHSAFVDIRSGSADTIGAARDFADCWFSVDVTEGQCTVPVQLSEFTQDQLILVYGDGPMSGEELGISTVSDGTLTAVAPESQVGMRLGVRFTSAFSPTPPILRDANGVAVGTERVGLLRYLLNMQNTGEFLVTIQDPTRGVDYTEKVSAVPMNSPFLDPDTAITVPRGSVTVPCRTTAESTTLRMHTSSGGELNVLSLEYILKHNQRRRRI